MIEWFVYGQIMVASVAGILAIALGLFGRQPTDLTLGAIGLVWLLLIAQVVVSLVVSLNGSVPTGNVLEYWVYLVSALLLPPAAGFWALIERSKWSTVIIGLAGVSVAIMIYRMWQIWGVQGI